MSSPHVFSHFRQHFIPETAWNKEASNSEQLRQAAAGGSKEARRDPVVKMAGLGPPRGARVQHAAVVGQQAATQHCEVQTERFNWHLCVLPLLRIQPVQKDTAAAAHA